MPADPLPRSGDEGGGDTRHDSGKMNVVPLIIGLLLLSFVATIRM